MSGWSRKSKGRLLLPVFFTALLIAVLAYPTLAHEEGEETANLFGDAETIIVPYVAHPSVVIDGKIGADEYSSAARFVDEDTGMEAYLLHDGENLYVALKNPGDGWVAIGFGYSTEDLDEGASVIAGYVDNGTLMIREFHASEITGEMEVEPVEELGGASSIISAEGVENGGTTIEFVVPLNASDEYGIHLEPGKIYPLIIAFSDSLKDFPSNLDEGEIHFEKAYIARQSDDIKEIEDLFAMKNGPYSPYDTVIAMTIVGLSSVALLVAYSRRG